MGSTTECDHKHRRTMHMINAEYMGSTTECDHKHRRTMHMLETENMRAWLSLANTVLVSIAMVIWYFAIWQEEKEEIDESKIIIIEDEKERKGGEIDKNTKGIKDDKGEFENPKEKQTNKDDEIANKIEEDFIQVEQQETDSVGVTFQWPRHKDTMEEVRSCKHELEDDVLDKLESLGIRRDSKCGETKDAEQDTLISRDPADENTNKTESQELEIPKPIKTIRKISLGATFQWPRHNDTVEELRAYKDDYKYELGSDVLDRLQSMGIRRKSEDTKADTTVPLADTARLSGKLLGKKVRICWDNFLAKSRPGLENEAELPRPNKSLNKRKKKSSKGGKKEDNLKKQSQTFVDIIKEENSSSVVCRLKFLISLFSAI